MFHKDIYNWINELEREKLVILGESHDDSWCELFEVALAFTFSSRQKTCLALEGYRFGELKKEDLKNDIDKLLFDIIRNNNGTLYGLEAKDRMDALYGVPKDNILAYREMFNKSKLKKTVGLTEYQRNREMASNLVKLCKQFPFVVAIVGAGHSHFGYSVNFLFEYFFNGKDSFFKPESIDYCCINLLKEENLRF